VQIKISCNAATRCLIKSRESAIKASFFVSQFITNNVSEFYRKEIYVKILFNLIALEESRFYVIFMAPNYWSQTVTEMAEQK
jgi:hypothetical protein